MPDSYPSRRTRIQFVANPTVLFSWMASSTGFRADSRVEPSIILSISVAGRPATEILKIIDGSTRESARNPVELAIQENKTVGLATNCILVRRDGYESGIEDSSAPIHNREGHVTGGVMVFHDVSVARALALQMSHLSQHDCLTDLPNR